VISLLGACRSRAKALASLSTLSTLSPFPSISTIILHSGSITTLTPFSNRHFLPRRLSRCHTGSHPSRRYSRVTPVTLRYSRDTPVTPCHSRVTLVTPCHSRVTPVTSRYTASLACHTASHSIRTCHTLSQQCLALV
jgi:hypothetical protein